ncbi:MAG: hypothetical protein COT85_03470 [Chlamydiae bacterium CG10_big_fil_rev_8_21_14_0_10_42_34]|nr:MAG: hypothetical protein COT85_03470 [Chlamydiae bacterium CG10_big_fil_rev_8_21_14_0_10_42_34]
MAKKSDPIAIIGGGPAGIHMAYLLSELGFTHIDLYEEKKEVGGRVVTYKHGGTLHELGACWTSPNYKPVHELMYEFGMKPPHIAGSTGRRTLVEAGAVPTEQKEEALLHSAVKYVWHYHENFGKYFEGGTVNWSKVPQKIVDLWQIPFESYLEKMDCLGLKKPFSLMLNAQGCGFIRSIPTYYGLYWITPGVLFGYRFYILDKLLSLLSEETQSSISKFLDYLFKKVHPSVAGMPLIVPQGFQTLFKRMAKHISKKVNICCQTKVQKIVRNDAEIIVSAKKDKAYKYVFSSIPWKNLPSVLIDLNSWESQIVQATKTYSMITALVKAKTTQKSYPNAVVSWLSGLSEKGQGHLYTLRHSKAALDRSKVPIRSKKDQEFVAYQVLDHSVTEKEAEELKKKLLEDLKNIAYLKEIRILKYNVYPQYNQHLEGKDLELLKQLEKNQGYKNSYFIGAGVCFESILNIFDYNQQVLKLFLR